MNIRQAVEVMKIIGPHAEKFTETLDSIKVMRAMIDALKDESPVHVLRLVALMEHKTLEEFAEEMYEADGEELIRRLAEGFNRNDLPSLVETAFHLGIATKRWQYGN
jgi:hypothetical protein